MKKFHVRFAIPTQIFGVLCLGLHLTETDDGCFVLFGAWKTLAVIPASTLIEFLKNNVKLETMCRLTNLNDLSEIEIMCVYDDGDIRYHYVEDGMIMKEEKTNTNFYETVLTPFLA